MLHISSTVAACAARSRCASPFYIIAIYKQLSADNVESSTAEFKLVRADLTQKLDQVTELSGEQRKAALSSAQNSLDEATELLEQIQLEKSNLPSASRSTINKRLRDYASDLDASKRKIQSLSSSRAALFGDRFTDDPDGEGSGGGDIYLEQRERLLSGTERLDRSTQRLKASQALASETEAIGASTLADLHTQRETIGHTTAMLFESEGYVDKSIKTLRGMARR
jgi:vesicle transport through interaction with t-SNAREs 1